MSTCTSCGGTIEDGYCNVCGLAAAPVPAAASAGSASAPAGSASAGSGSGGQPPDVGRQGFPADQRPVGAGSARGGAGRDPAGALPRPGQRRARQPAGAGEPALLRQLRAACRARPGWPGGADGGVLSELRHPVLVQPEARAGRVGGGAVRGPLAPDAHARHTARPPPPRPTAATPSAPHAACPPPRKSPTPR